MSFEEPLKESFSDIFDIPPMEKIKSSQVIPLSTKKRLYLDSLKLGKEYKFEIKHNDSKYPIIGTLIEIRYNIHRYSHSLHSFFQDVQSVQFVIQEKELRVPTQITDDCIAEITECQHSFFQDVKSVQFAIKEKEKELRVPTQITDDDYIDEITDDDYIAEITEYLHKISKPILEPGPEPFSKNLVLNKKYMFKTKTHEDEEPLIGTLVSMFSHPEFYSINGDIVKCDSVTLSFCEIEGLEGKLTFEAYILSEISPCLK